MDEQWIQQRAEQPRSLHVLTMYSKLCRLPVMMTVMTPRTMLSAVVAMIILAAASTTASAQIQFDPKHIKECESPLFPWGQTLRQLMDSCAMRGANVSSYRLDGTDTVLDLRLPRIRMNLHVNETGYYKFVIEQVYDADVTAKARHEDILLYLRQWYIRQERYKIYDERYTQKCGGMKQSLWAVTGSENDKPGTMILTFERRPL
jgi:hypothetical protein